MTVSWWPARCRPWPRQTLGSALVTAAVACEVIFILGKRRLSAPVEPLATATLMSADGLPLPLPADGVAGAVHGEVTSDAGSPRL